MRRTLVVVALTASFLTATPSGLLEPFWSLLSSFLSGEASEAGCGVDPFGDCNTAPESDAGCRLDPYGCPQGS